MNEEKDVTSLVIRLGNFFNIARKEELVRKILISSSKRKALEYLVNLLERRESKDIRGSLKEIKLSSVKKSLEKQKEKKESDFLGQVQDGTFETIFGTSFDEIVGE